MLFRPSRGALFGTGLVRPTSGLPVGRPHGLEVHDLSRLSTGGRPVHVPEGSPVGVLPSSGPGGAGGRQRIHVLMRSMARVVLTRPRHVR